MSDVKDRGYVLSPIQLPQSIRHAVEERDWPKLDSLIRVQANRGGAIFEEMQKYERFSEIEFIISIRSSREFPDEDGIWHDDGSRVLAFSLSLTLEPQKIVGGRLELRPRSGGESSVIPTPDYGTMIIFATGVSGFEHKINLVAEGERLIIAGWCT